MWAPVHLGGYAAAAKKENASTFQSNKSFERLFTNKTWNISQARWLLILNIAGAALHAILAIVLLILAGSNRERLNPKRHHLYHGAQLERGFAGPVCPDPCQVWFFVAVVDDIFLLFAVVARAHIHCAPQLASTEGKGCCGGRSGLRQHVL